MELNDSIQELPSGARVANLITSVSAELLAGDSIRIHVIKMSPTFLIIADRIIRGSPKNIRLPVQAFLLPFCAQLC